MTNTLEEAREIVGGNYNEECPCGTDTCHEWASNENRRSLQLREAIAAALSARDQKHQREVDELRDALKNTLGGQEDYIEAFDSTRRKQLAEEEGGR